MVPYLYMVGMVLKFLVLVRIFFISNGTLNLEFCMICAKKIVSDNVADHTICYL